MNLKKYKYAEITRHINYNLIPVNTFLMNTDGIKEFNIILKEIKQQQYNSIIRTISGGISKRTRIPAFDVRSTKSCIELTILIKDGMARFQCRGNVSPSPNNIRGRQAFRRFKEILKQFNINLDDYIIKNGAEVKKEIPKYIIKAERSTFCGENRTFYNAHHIDFHSSFPAGLVNTHPEFKDAITYIYNKRKEDEIYKAILNLSIGFMQSESCCSAKWAHLSKDAIADNNKRVLEMAQKLKESGRVVLSYNTDGIWYVGEIFHGENEGNKLGQWENDHINCKFRMKSAGSYEFEENGVYKPVVRGHTTLDQIKERDNWVWGDIFNINAVVKQYILTDDGIKELGENDNEW